MTDERGRRDWNRFRLVITMRREGSTLKECAAAVGSKVAERARQMEWVAILAIAERHPRMIDLEPLTVRERGLLSRYASDLWMDLIRRELPPPNPQVVAACRNEATPWTFHKTM